jgi:NAD(P)-dependent dehydrogenase (short-subunit alcohol dehydrogenase family)
MFETFAGGAALVFGATGGIGAAFVRRLVTSGTFEPVIGASRHSQPAFDLTDEASIAAVVQAAAAQAPLRLVIDATGFLHDEQQGPEKSLRDLDAAKLARNFALNAIGPALIMKHVLPLLPADGKSVFATLSARVGSIGDNHLGGWYGYRASKTALNQLMRTAAIETRRRRPNAICVSLHPGTVNTGLSSPFAKDGLDVQTPDQSAARLLQVIENLQPSDHGSFFDHHGKTIPW